jgi:ferredoxin
MSTNSAKTLKTVGKYTIKVIDDKCISAAACVGIAMGTFELDENNIAKVIDEQGDDPEMQLLAAQSCPTNAIIIIDNETGKQVWPPES